MKCVKFRVVLLVVLILLMSLITAVQGAETDESDAGYDPSSVASGTWITKGYGSCTRIYATTDKEMRDYLKSTGLIHSDVVTNMTKEVLINEYLRCWKSDNLTYISVEGDWDGVGKVYLCKPDGTKDDSFSNKNRLAKMVPNEPVVENGLPGWYTGISNGKYGLDKVKTAYSGYPFTATPNDEPYKPDYPIYNDDGSLKSESMTYTVLDTLGKLDEFNLGEKVYIFFQIGVKPLIKIVENGVRSDLDPSTTQAWGDYFGVDGYAHGKGFVDVLYKYNVENNPDFDEGDIVRGHPNILSGFTYGANYVRKAILGKYMKETWANGAMDAMFISYDDGYSVRKVHKISGYEGALGVGYQELSRTLPQIDNYIDIDASFKLNKSDTGIELCNFKDIMPIYSLNKEQYGKSVALGALGSTDIAFGVPTIIADSLYTDRTVAYKRNIDALQLMTRLYPFVVGGSLPERFNNVFVPIRDTYSNLVSHYDNNFVLTGFDFNSHDTDNQFFKLEGNNLVGVLVVPKYLSEKFCNITGSPVSLDRRVRVCIKAKNGTFEINKTINGGDCDVVNSCTNGKMRSLWFDINVDISTLLAQTGNNKPSATNPIDVSLSFTCETVANIAVPVYFEFVKNDGQRLYQLVDIVDSDISVVQEGDIDLLKRTISHEKIAEKIDDKLVTVDYDSNTPLNVEFRRDEEDYVSGTTLSNTIDDYVNGNIFSTQLSGLNNIYLDLEDTNDGLKYVEYAAFSQQMLSGGNAGSIVCVFKEKQPNPSPLNSEYTVDEEYLTKYYPERTTGNFPNFTVTKNSYSPMTGTKTVDVTKTTNSSGLASPLPTYNGVTWDSTKGDSHSYVTNYNYYTHKTYAKKHYEEVEPEGWSEWSFSTTTRYSSSVSPVDTDTRQYRNGVNEGALTKYDVYTRYWKSAQYDWVDASGTMSTCTPSGSKTYPALPTSTTSLPSGYKWSCTSTTQFQEVRDYTHTYTFNDPFTHPFANFEEYGVSSTENMAVLIYDKLNDNKYKSKTVYEDIQMSGINTSLLFSRVSEDKPTLAEWMGVSSDYPLNGFPIDAVPSGSRTTSKIVSGNYRLTTATNSIRWIRDFTRNIFNDVLYEYTSFSVPTLPTDDMSVAINVYRTSSRPNVNYPFHSVKTFDDSVFYFADSASGVRLYPEVKMKYQNNSGNTLSTYVIGDEKRHVSCVSGVSVKLIEPTAELKMEVPYARDAAAKDLDNSIPGYSGVVPSGSAFALSSTSDGVIQIKTYDVKVIDEYEALWGNVNNNLTNHNDVVNEINSALPLKMKFKVEDNIINNLETTLKFDPRINISKGSTTVESYGIDFDGETISYDATVPDNVVFYINNSDLKSRLDNALIESGGTGGWYNETATNTLEIQVYTTNLVLKKPRDTGYIPYNFGPSTSKFTSQYKNGHRAEFFYSISPPVTFTFMGDSFVMDIPELSTLNRKFIISDNSVDDF